MGSPISAPVKETAEALAALVALSEAVGPKLAGGLTLEEAAAAWDEAAGAIAVGVEGFSLDVLGKAFAEEPEGTIEAVAAAVLKSAGVLAGKPVLPVEGSETAEIVDAVGSVLYSALGAPGIPVVKAVFSSLVVNSAKIRKAVEGRELIGAQFAANPFGQVLTTVSQALGWVKAIRGELVALKAAGA